MIISPWGEILCEADDGDAVITAQLDIAKITAARRAIPSLISSAIIGTTRSTGG
jgi:predicted amidohydrolase